MAIVAVGKCVNGMVRHSVDGVVVDGRRVWGVTSPTPCKECEGKGCPKSDAAKTDAS